MKKNVLPMIAAIVFAALPSYSFAQNWDYATSAGGHGNDRGTAIATDTSGNTYVAGTFTGTMSFAQSAATLSCAGFDDCFIAAYDAAGVLVWATRFGGAGMDEATDIVYADDALYVTGDFVGTAYIDTDTLTSTGGADVFLLKLDAATGAVVYARAFGGQDDDEGHAIAYGNGRVCITGTFATALPIGNHTLLSRGNTDVFVGAFDASTCAPLWSASGGSPAADDGSGITVAPNGDCYAVGIFGASMQAQSAIFGSDTLTSAGYADGFILKYDSSGVYRFSRQISGNAYEHVEGVCSIGAGKCAVVGSMPQGTTSFGQHVLSTTNSISGFVALYDSSGTNLWAKKANGYSVCGDVVCDPSGRIYVCGNFADVCVFGTIALASPANRDIFVATVDSNGIFCSAAQGGGADNQEDGAIALDAAGRIHVIGNFYGASATFGNYSISNANALGTSQDVFFAMLSGSATDVVEVENKKVITVYPSPFSDRLTVDFSADGEWEFVLSDALGQTVMRRFLGASVAEIETENLPAGIYFVTAYQQGVRLASAKVIAR